MKRKVLGMLFVTIAAALVIGVGADFASYDATRSAHIAVVADDNELIDLTPGQVYAYINDETGIMTVDISKNNPNWVEGDGLGVSPESRYNIDNVFYVSNHLWAGDSTDRILVTVQTIEGSGIKLYSSIALNGEVNSNSADHSIQFYLLKGEQGDVGLDIVPGAAMPGTILNTNINVNAVAAPVAPG